MNGGRSLAVCRSWSGLGSATVCHRNSSVNTPATTPMQMPHAHGMSPAATLKRAITGFWRFLSTDTTSFAPSFHLSAGISTRSAFSTFTFSVSPTGTKNSYHFSCFGETLSATVVSGSGAFASLSVSSAVVPASSRIVRGSMITNSSACGAGASSTISRAAGPASTPNTTGFGPLCDSSTPARMTSTPVPMIIERRQKVERMPLNSAWRCGSRPSM